MSVHYALLKCLSREQRETEEKISELNGARN